MSLDTKLSIWLCFMSVGMWFGGLWFVHWVVAH